LRELDTMLQTEEVRAQILPIVERVRADLAQKEGEVMAWEPIPLSIYRKGLPGRIRSSWIFFLRAGTNTGPERHPNSHQRMMSLEGRVTCKFDLQQNRHASGRFWRAIRKRRCSGDGFRFRRTSGISRS